ncbi:fatty acid desaturase [Streptomyces sp. G-G2]|uniref:fatty acid desaturase family protein n=1 Tax=Streptomyces sp. G-G2 TaxID=3046201 RepID=UPI0024BA7326|nr:fatty acid desaturase [Streptomyces sp. G-G2]MDJ0382826.1 fatty acid desaturase [Streptomyces sp. G-G2]
MPIAEIPRKPQLLYARARVTGHDQTIFIIKLCVAAALVTAGALLTAQDGLLPSAAGVVLLAAVYTHMVELQHQSLHHTAFTSAKPHRITGIPLGLPLLVSYTHYRVRHLQHHKQLGTPQDSEFFGFDTRAPLTWGMLARGAFDYGRLYLIGREIVRSCRGTWEYDAGDISDRRRAEITTEYRWMALLPVAAVALAIAGYGGPVLELWVLPLLVAAPMHFLLELPEHILCDTETTDVLRNTRSITGSWFSTWYTNGNNLHVEHHAAMTVSINRLRARHGEVTSLAKYVDRSYPSFFLAVAREATRNSRRSPEAVAEQAEAARAVRTPAPVATPGPSPVSVGAPRRDREWSE